MRGAALPAAMLCVAWALMLAFAPRRAIIPSAVLLVTLAGIACFLPVSGSAVELAFFGCWASLVLIAAGIHLPRGVPASLAIGAGGLAGSFAGLVIAAEGSRADLAVALPLAIVALPARWIVERGWGIAVKVVSSWLIAVALLAALLPTTTATPGYVPDHMD